MSIAVLSIDLVAKLANFEQGMNRAQQIAEKNSAAIQKTFDNIGKAIAAIGIASIVAGQIDKVREAIDKFDDLAEKYGIAADKLSAYSYASEVAGTTTEAFASGINKLGKNLAEAAGGGAQQIAVFKALGVEIKNTDGSLRSQDDVLLDLADKFASYEGGASKAALAQKLFGKSGADMIPILDKGRQGIQDLTDEAQRSGLVVGNDAAKAAGDFNDNLKRIELSSKSLYQELASNLLPTLLKSTNEFIEGKKAYGGFVSALLDIGINVDPFKTLKESIAVTVEEIGKKNAALAEAQSRADRIAKGTAGFADKFFDLGSGDAERAGLKDELDLLAKRLRYLQQMDGIQTRTAKESIFGTGTPTLKQAPVVDSNVDKKADRAARAAERAREQAQKSYDDLIAKIQAKIDATQIEIDTGQKASDADQLQIETLKELNKTGVQYTNQQRTGIKATLDDAVSKIKLAEAQREAIRETNEASRALASQIGAYDDANKAIQDQIQEVGLSVDKLDELRIARLDDAIAQKEQRLAAEILFGATADQIAQENILIDKMREGRAARQALVAVTNKQGTDPLEGAKAGIEDYLKSVEKAGDRSRAAVNKSIGALEDDLTTSLTSGKFSIKGFVDTVISEFLRLQVVTPIVEGLLGDPRKGTTGLLGSGLAAIFGGGLFAKGSAFDAAGAVPFARGDVFGTPHLFKFASGSGMSTGVLGEAGPEAVMPLKRGADGKLGVVSGGGSGGAIVNNFSYSIGAGVTRGDVYTLMQAYGQRLKGEILLSQRNKGAFSRG